MITLTDKLLGQIYQHVRQSYPHECCGILAGKNSPDKEIVSVYPVDNLNQERAHDRYEIDPKQFHKVDTQIRAQGLSVLGIYHSHPDHPAEPSEFDTQRAWEGYSYVIVAVSGGKTVLAKSWTLNKHGRFEEEQIVDRNKDYSNG